MPFQPGQSGNPAGRIKGTMNRKTILHYLLFEADIDGMGIVKNKPSWWDKVGPKTLYEAMTVAMGVKALSGDERAFSALNKALGDRVDLTSGDLPIPILGGTAARPALPKKKAKK